MDSSSSSSASSGCSRSSEEQTTSVGAWQPYHRPATADDDFSRSHVSSEPLFRDEELISGFSESMAAPIEPTPAVVVAVVVIVDICCWCSPSLLLAAACCCCCFDRRYSSLSMRFSSNAELT